MVLPHPPAHRCGVVPLVAAGLLSLFAFFCYRAADDSSTTFDEPVHLLAGVSYWSAEYPDTTTGNLRASQLWMTLPLLPLDLHYPNVYRDRPGLVGDASLTVLREFMHEPRHDPGQILRRSRAAVTLLGVALGMVLFLWSRRLHGDTAALVCLGLYCLEPTVIAHSALATTDIAATLLFTLSLAAWWRLLHRPDLVSLLGAGAATGLLATTKISAGLLGPAVAIMVVAWAAQRRARVRSDVGAAPAEFPLRAVAVASFGALLLAYGVIWMVYGFHYAPGRPVPESTWINLLLPHASVLQRLLNVLRVGHLLPEAYLYDLNSFLNNLEGRRAFLLGRYSLEGWWTYFPVAWLTKTSLVTLGAVLLSLVVFSLACVRRRVRWAAVYPLVPLLAFAAIYIVSALRSPMNIGIRHLLPAYPTLYVLTGLGVAVAADALGRARPWFWAAGLLAALTTAVAASPYFLAYFHPLAGGSNRGHRILVESNCDWGQDLPRLGRWLRERETRPDGGRPVYFSYYGLGDPARYGIRARLLPQEPDFRAPSLYALEPGTYIISATMLESLGGRWAWGPWRPSYERVYRALAAELGPQFAAGPIAVPADAPAEFRQKVELFDELRLIRLCSHLRRREPAVYVTPGVLAFELDAADLQAALEAPIPFAPEPVIKGLSRRPPDSIDFLR